ncbi:hypothetical protein NQ318_002767 [Aromia moschata]|uniref:CRAL-TRIO domain-containing protein n=1 Tax=Aromia moschata TaxID=1265417 RepID=A0AAV8X4G7_9CUCU|nr:hypothetical protein NQ318_002767 [Aromia moschata]
MSASEEMPIKATMELEEPSGELIEWAKDNINEDPDKREQIISEFRDLIYGLAFINNNTYCKISLILTHLVESVHPIVLMMLFLLRFLRARHFIVRKAHRLLINYYKFKESNPQYFDNVKLERLRELANEEIISVPPYRDQFGRRIMIFRIGAWDPSEYKINELFQLTMGIIELAAMEPQVQIKGGLVIFDLSQLSVTHAWQMTPTIANNIVQIAMVAQKLSSYRKVLSFLQMTSYVIAT